MPGYTHRQKAMLSSIGLWIGAYAESFMDDFEVLSKAYELNDQNPLGSAASFGVPKNIDREFTTKLMGFSKTQKNTLYCQNSRGKIESIIVSALSQIMITIGKLSADLILFSTNEFGYIKLGNEVSTGSSIMPQKRNPDVPELMKGNVSIVLGYENIIKNAIKDLPSGYNKESQVVKEHTIKSILLTMDSIDMMQICIDTLTINDEICKKSCTKELFATDLAYDLVDQGIPFREAYNKIASEIDSIEVPDLNEAIKKRCHIGAPGNLGLDKLSKNIELKELQPRIVKILKSHGIKKAGIFGSYARGTQKKSSDIDILVLPAKKMGFAFFGLQIELEEKLGKKVDLVSYNGISPYLKDKILSQEVRII